jgi:hypothetical protein
LSELHELPTGLREVGAELLRRVRETYGGYFQRTSAGRYVNRNDNFWTIKVQPRDVSYSITVRGYPHEYQAVTGVSVKEDRRGYSRFKIGNPAQLDAAWAVLKHAAER